MDRRIMTNSFSFMIIVSYSILMSCNSNYKDKTFEFENKQLLSTEALRKATRFESISETINSDTVYKLILFGQGLTNIPKQLKKLTFLNSLELSRNKIKTAGTDLKYLPYLQNLYLDHNLFTELPAEITQLARLKKLSMANNKIETISGSISRLVFLEHLDLNRNNIHKLPIGMRRLSKLKVLKLSNNNLRSIPFSLDELPALEFIDLSNNKLENIPKGISKLGALKTIDFFGNNIPKKDIDSLRLLLPKSVKIKD